MLLLLNSPKAITYPNSTLTGVPAGQGFLPCSNTLLTLFLLCGFIINNGGIVDMHLVSINYEYLIHHK
jgi:hypothetical protein